MQLASGNFWQLYDSLQVTELPQATNVWSQQYNRRVKRSVTVREFSKKRRETDFSLSGENDSLSRADFLRAELRCTPPPPKNILYFRRYLYPLWFILLPFKKQASISCLGHTCTAAQCVRWFLGISTISWHRFFPPMLSLISLGQAKRGHMTMPGLPPFT